MNAPKGMAPPGACLARARLGADAVLRGWCYYPDRPDERARIELRADGEVVATTEAARLDTDVRGGGGHDGHCGFFFAVEALIKSASVLEARERRLGRVLFRRLRDPADMGPRAVRLAAAEAEGAALLRRLEALEAEKAQERLRAVDWPSAGRPWLSLALRARGDLTALVAWLGRAAARAPAGIEPLLIDDGRLPGVRLLPRRLRGLGVIAARPGEGLADLLDAALLSAQGEEFAVAATGLFGLDTLMEDLGRPGGDTFRFAGDAALLAACPPPGLLCRAPRSALLELGGFGGGELGLRAAMAGFAITAPGGEARP